MTPPDLNDLEVPSTRATALAAGLLAASALFCTVAGVAENPAPALVASPFFVGVVVGFLARRWPVRAAILVTFVVLEPLWIWFAAMWGARAVQLIGAAFMGACLIGICVAPLAVLGAICGATIAKWVRGRAPRAHAERWP
jgi:hypothetical protein